MKISLYTRLGTRTIGIHLSVSSGKLKIIKDGSIFCLIRLEEQRLVALLQGSVESDDYSSISLKL